MNNSKWPDQIRKLTDQIEQSVAYQIKDGLLTSEFDTDTMYHAIIDSIDSLDNARALLRDHKQLLYNKEADRLDQIEEDRMNYLKGTEPE